MKKKHKTAVIAIICTAVLAIAGYNIEKHSNTGFVIETATQEEMNEYNSTDTRVYDGRININTADKELLETLDGIGESMAQRIIDYRTENGGFENIEDIMKVDGIGEKKFGAIKDKICCLKQNGEYK